MATRKQPDVLKPLEQAKYNRSIAMAIQAVALGNASEGQQKQVMHWIIHELCRTYDDPLMLGAEAMMKFAGRRNVGLQIVKLINIKPEIIPE